MVSGGFVKEKIKVLAFAGSLRKKSYNKALIHLAVDLTPENVSIEVFDLEGIPAVIEGVIVFIVRSML